MSVAVCFVSVLEYTERRKDPIARASASADGLARTESAYTRKRREKSLAETHCLHGGASRVACVGGGAALALY